jgi:tRNA(fMet)-specific endonuclease VapC
MLGNRYLLDTNALIALLKGDQGLLALCKSADWLGVSVVSLLEFSSFRTISPQDQALVAEFAAAVTVVELAYSNQALFNEIVQIRQRTSLKLPDAIVMASAKVCNATLVTNDQRLLNLTTQNLAGPVQSF